MRYCQTNLVRAMLWALVIVSLSTAAGYILGRYIQPKPPAAVKQEKRDRRPAPRVKIQPWLDHAKKYALV